MQYNGFCCDISIYVHNILWSCSPPHNLHVNEVHELAPGESVILKTIFKPVFPYIFFSRVKSWASLDLQRSLWQSVVLAPGSTLCAFSLQCFAAGVCTSLIDTVGEAFSLPTKGWYQFRNTLGHFFFHTRSFLVLPIKLPRVFVNYHYISWTLC